ncbi:response regulator [Pedobacter alpinus]|uniref:Response regulator n=1 Tax=Pedobacter alpinus TaxID=1590643 RepID=A0ABW5TTG8_9SPHI
MMKKIPIAIVDDKRLLRNSLKEQLNFSDDVDVLFLAEDGADFLQQMEKLNIEKRPLVVMMDIEMPRMDGLETVLIAKEIYPDVQFIMLTVFDDEDKIFEAIKAGACGYLLKDEKISVIIKSIKSVVEDGAVPMSAIIARKTLNLVKLQTPLVKDVLTEEFDYQLSIREMSILELIVDGLNYNEIAEKLFISPHTVRKHISNIYDKLHVSNKTAAIKIALKKKWF